MERREGGSAAEPISISIQMVSYSRLMTGEHIPFIQQILRVHFLPGVSEGLGWDPGANETDTFLLSWNYKLLQMVKNILGRKK